MRDALEGGDTIVVTGLVLQELLQGFSGRRRERTSLTVSRRCRFWLRTGSIISTLRSAQSLPPRRVADRHDRRRDCAAVHSSLSDAADNRQRFVLAAATLRIASLEGGTLTRTILLVECDVPGVKCRFRVPFSSPSWAINRGDKFSTLTALAALPKASPAKSLRARRAAHRDGQLLSEANGRRGSRCA